ncbi:hypothetical protein Tco_1421073 [Tanacetum coccineum]
MHIHVAHGERGWMSREAWASDGMLAILSWRGLFPKHQSSCTETAGGVRRLRELRAADRTRQQQIIQTLTAMQTLQEERRFHFRDWAQQGPAWGVCAQAELQGRIQVAVLRLDFVMASRFVFSLLCITGIIPASKALVRFGARDRQPGMARIAIFGIREHRMGVFELPNGALNMVEFRMLWTVTHRVCILDDLGDLKKKMILMDKRVGTIVERQAENKRKLENTSRSNQSQQQQQNKRQNTGRAYMMDQASGALQKGLSKRRTTKGNRGYQAE